MQSSCCNLPENIYNQTTSQRSSRKKKEKGDQVGGRKQGLMKIWTSHHKDCFCRYRITSSHFDHKRFFSHNFWSSCWFSKGTTHLTQQQWTGSVMIHNEVTIAHFAVWLSLGLLLASLQQFCFQHSASNQRLISSYETSPISILFWSSKFQKWLCRAELCVRLCPVRPHHFSIFLF